MSEIQLKPCPFCGKIPTIRQCSTGHSIVGTYSGSYVLVCENCNVKIVRDFEFRLKNNQLEFTQDGYNELVSLWNTRVDKPSDKIWVPKIGEKYWYCSNSGNIGQNLRDCSTYDAAMCKIGNCYRTPEEAKANVVKWVEFFNSDEVVDVWGKR